MKGVGGDFGRNKAKSSTSDESINGPQKTREMAHARCKRRYRNVIMSGNSTNLIGENSQVARSNELDFHAAEWSFIWGR